MSAAREGLIALLRHAAQSGPLDGEALERMAGRALGLTEPVDVAKLRQRLADTEALAEARLVGLREAVTLLSLLSAARPGIAANLRRLKRLAGLEADDG